MRHPLPWTLPLPDYLGPFPVELSLSDRDTARIRSTGEDIQSMRAWDHDELPYPWRPDLRIRVRLPAKWELVGSILIDDAQTSERLGGVSIGLPVVFEPHRGRGIGAEIVCVSDSLDRFALGPVRYSLEGFRARRAAHRLQLERALLMAPKDVSAGALDWYEGTAGRDFRLAREWGVEDQNATARLWRKDRRAESA